jgi:hypothetical protein
MSGLGCLLGVAISGWACITEIQRRLRAGGMRTRLALIGALMHGFPAGTLHASFATAASTTAAPATAAS